MRFGRLVAVCAAVVASGCASLSVERNASEAASLARPFADVNLRVMPTAEERRQATAEVDLLLFAPLSQEGAVRIATAYSPAFQAMLFEAAAASADATQAARIPNPLFTFDRLTRTQGGDVDKDIGRMLAFSVFDVLLLPARLRANDHRQQQLRLRLAGDVIQAVAEVRQAWVRAVAAEQAVAYADDVKGAAEAGAELARRMQAVGNFSKLQRAREQAFYAEAAAQVARAQQTRRASHEALVRILGLDAQQADRLQLDARLPELPQAPLDEGAVTRTALDERLDVRMAKAELEYLAARHGLTRVTGYVDGLQIAAVHNSQTGKPPQRGFEIEVPLPLFDFGDARRAQSEGAYMAAVNRAAAVAANASSRVRESYSAYRTAYDLARHYRDEIVPLRKVIADEMLLRYNGMLASVFELLSDSREQIGSVMQAMDAQRDFWIADAGLKAALIGRPLEATGH